MINGSLAISLVNRWVARQCPHILWTCIVCYSRDELQNLLVTLSSQMESSKIGQEVLVYVLRTMLAINHVQTFMIEIFSPLPDRLLEEVRQDIGEQRSFAVEAMQFIHVPGDPYF